jgi:hypothetical protein
MNKHKILKIGRYILYHYVFIDDDKPYEPDECYVFSQEQPGGKDKFLHGDGTFRYRKNWKVPYYRTLEQIITAFKKFQPKS